MIPCFKIVLNVVEKDKKVSKAGGDYFTAKVVDYGVGGKLFISADIYNGIKEGKNEFEIEVGVNKTGDIGFGKVLSVKPVK